MRYIDIERLLQEHFATPEGEKDRKRLERAQKKTEAKQTAQERSKYISDNGPNKWSPLKAALTKTLGNKCWYTEVELVGAPLAVDHFRPKALYWWLAFDAENYRFACPYSNSPAHNAEHGCAGGKGEEFPLLAGTRATTKMGLKSESPVLLDPCDSRDCSLIAFSADGRPVLHPSAAGDATARTRLAESMLLLNLDHPAFNAKRERLYHYIKSEVAVHNELPDGSPQRGAIQERLLDSLSPSAQFSTAARYYLKLQRHHEWVDQLLKNA